MNKKNFKEITDFIRSLYPQEDKIPLHSPRFRGNEKKFLAECIDSTYVSSVGRFVDLFEEKVAEYTGSKKAVVCVNGTSALHLALKINGVYEGTDVITQPLTFIATANSIIYCGANPIFLDVDRDTLGLSPAKLEAWLNENIEFRELDERSNTPHLTPRPYNRSTNRLVSACIPMHTFGHPCRILEIAEICSKYNIPLIEDSAESMGSLYRNCHTGTFGKTGVLSFNGNKILTTGGGGMLLFNDTELAAKAKHLSTQAKVPHSWEYNHDEVGYNYRMPNINAALGLAQLEQLESFIVAKRELANKYRIFFESLSIEFISEPVGTRSNYWLNSILMTDKDEREKFLRFSNEQGILTRPAWTLISELPMFKMYQRDKLENSILISDRLINLPSSVI